MASDGVHHVVRPSDPRHESGRGDPLLLVRDSATTSRCGRRSWSSSETPRHPPRCARHLASSTPARSGSGARRSCSSRSSTSGASNRRTWSASRAAARSRSNSPSTIQRASDGSSSPRPIAGSARFRVAAGCHRAGHPRCATTPPASSTGPPRPRRAASRPATHRCAALHDRGARRSHPPSADGYALQLLGIVGWSSWHFLRSIPHETLVICGDDDPLVPVANAQQLAERIPNATIEIVAGAGHLFLWDDAENLGRRIGRFLDRSSRRSRGFRSFESFQTEVRTTRTYRTRSDVSREEREFQLEHGTRFCLSHRTPLHRETSGDSQRR